MLMKTFPSKRIVFSLLILVSLATSFIDSNNPVPPVLGKVVEQNIVSIYASEGQYSGTVVGYKKDHEGESNLILTTLHGQVAVGVSLVVVDRDDKIYKGFVLYSSNKPDYAIILSEVITTQKIKIGKVRDNVYCSYRVLEKKYIETGYFFGMWLNYQIFTPRIRAGASGGGFFNEKNELVGIICMFHKYFPITLCSSAKEVEKDLIKMGLGDFLWNGKP